MCGSEVALDRSQVCELADVLGGETVLVLLIDERFGVSLRKENEGDAIFCGDCCCFFKLRVVQRDPFRRTKGHPAAVDEYVVGVPKCTRPNERVGNELCCCSSPICFPVDAWPLFVSKDAKGTRWLLHHRALEDAFVPNHDSVGVKRGVIVRRPGEPHFTAAHGPHHRIAEPQQRNRWSVGARRWSRRRHVGRELRCRLGSWGRDKPHRTDHQRSCTKRAESHIGATRARCRRGLVQTWLAATERLFDQIPADCRGDRRERDADEEEFDFSGAIATEVKSLSGDKHFDRPMP